MLTAYGQAWLPQPVGSLANSAGSWVLVAFVLGLLAPSWRAASLCGIAALACLLAGYIVGSQMRG